jgi:hypothetical protein
MDTFTVVFDACVLYPAPLRDVLLELSVEGIFRARWTDQIHDEWIRNVLANNSKVTPEKLQRTRELMNAAVRDCLITGYEKIIESLNLPDSNDRHVLAAAIVARAGAIVTFNVKHFPQGVLEEFGLEAQHPDDFLVYQFDLAPAAVCTAIKRLRARLKHPPMNVEEYLTCLLRQQLPQFVEKLRRYGHVI